MTKTIKKVRTYWVRYYWGECPVCGRDKSYRERVYDEPKPEDDFRRNVQLPDSETYCGCMAQ